MELFAYDYAKISDFARAFQNASDLTALWWDDEKQSVFNLWCMTVGKERPRASDFDRFRALCEMMPMLVGHPVQRHCADFLKQYFQCEIPMDEAHCDEIWRMTADALLLQPKRAVDLFDEPIGLLWESEELPHGLPNHMQPILPAERLMNLHAPDWKAWCRIADAELDAFAACGCNRAVVRLHDDFHFEAPNLYRVEQILQLPNKKIAKSDLLLTQVVRYLSEACAARHWMLQLEIGDCAIDAAILLSYVEDTVGLPTLLWSTPSARTRDKMLAFASRERKNPILPILCLADYPSDRELADALTAYAARYPIGMLSYATGTDLSNVASERQRLLTMIEK